MNFQRLTIVVQEKTASNPAHRSKLSDVHWFDVYFLRITIVSGAATLSIIYSGKIMSMLEKNRKEFSRQCFRERMRTLGKPYFTRALKKSDSKKELGFFSYFHYNRNIRRERLPC